MSDRYRYPPRPRSPTFNSARMSLPVISAAYSGYEQPHHHVIPAGRREIIPPRSSSSASTAPTVQTIYKVTTDPLQRGSSVREGSRTRRSTIDNHSRPPTIVTSSPRHRPVIHSAGGVRPASPLKNPYRSSEEDYVAIPASSRHGHHHRKHHSATMDNGEIRGGGLRVAPVREPNYSHMRARPIYPSTLVRHADNVAEDYGENGYGYTNPQDLVRYDLGRSAPPPAPVSRPRRDSFDGRTSRPSSITGYSDLMPRSYDNRERGPPPSTRGFDRIPQRATWEQPQIRVPPSPSMAPMDPIPRPVTFEPIEPVRRNSSRNSSRARPTSMYHEREARRVPREDYYEVRDDERDRRDKYHHHERREEVVEQRPFGSRGERSERNDRTDRSERDRNDRHDRHGSDEDRSDRDHKEHKGREALATLGSIGAAALGLQAVKNSTRDDRDERDDRRRDYDEEPRRRSDRDDRDSVDLSGRDPKERRHHDDVPPPPRVSPPPRDGPAPRDIPAPPRVSPPPRDKDPKDVSPPTIDLSNRDPRERKPSKDEDRYSHRRSRSDAAEREGADSLSDSSVSPDDTSHPRRESRLKRSSGLVAGAAAGGATAAAFNPKDTMDLKALKEALNSAATSKPEPAKEPAPSRTPRESLTKDPREVTEIRKELNERQSRPLAPNDNIRVVSPPREKPEEKPVKGILRAPREKFPEDPAPIREGVAPLKDAKKDGIPPDARWTKISRKLVNPEALEAGKERFEAREDFVIVLRVLSRDEVQGYAEVTQRIRAAREELEELESKERRRKRRERHERHKRERLERGADPNPERERSHRYRRRHSNSSSESSDSEDRPKLLDAPPSAGLNKRGGGGEEIVMSGGLGGERGDEGRLSNVQMGREAGSSLPMGGRDTSHLWENPDVPGQYLGYVRNPPMPQVLKKSSV